MKESLEMYADPLSSGVNSNDRFSSDIECSIIVDDFASTDEDMKLRKGSFFLGKDSDIYTDKNLVETELPELRVCYKETAYHLVRDIYVDEGFSSSEKRLVSSDKDHRGDIVKESVVTENFPEVGIASESNNSAWIHATKGNEDAGLLVANYHNGNCTSLPNNKCDISIVSRDNKIPIQDTFTDTVAASYECWTEEVLGNDIGSKLLAGSDADVKAPEEFGSEDLSCTCPPKNQGDISVQSLDAENPIQDGQKKLNSYDVASHECWTKEELTTDNGSIGSDKDVEACGECGLVDQRCTSLPIELCNISEESLDAENPFQDELKMLKVKDYDAASHECGTNELGTNNGSKLSVESVEGLEECGSGDLKEIGDAAFPTINENVMDVPSKEEIASTSILPVKESRGQTSLKSLLDSAARDLDAINELPAQNHVEDVSKSDSVVIPAAEEFSISGQTTNLDSKVDVGASNNHIDLTKSSSITGKKVHENGHSFPFQSQNVPGNEDEASDRVAITSQVQRGESGETSFSVAGPVSGLITYSGPIAYAGSVSHRSDSSTTSTRSFAFPILQSEWNSSPVKMARGDRRHLRKHRGWRHGILCCKF